MLMRFLPRWLAGLIVATLLILNVIISGSLVFILGLIKLVLPFKAMGRLLHLAYAMWCAGNRLALWLGCRELDIQIEGEINPGAWYLLISNHLSWLDIIVLSSIKGLPAPKFFLKDELKYVPLIGSGAWAMDMPFMKRASKEQIAKNPKLKGMDVERTKRSCRNFRNHPSSIINFVEGSRFTAQKHRRQQSPFRHLLKPKAGGIAFALEVLGEQFDGLLDTSIVYTSKTDHICRDFSFGRLESIHVRVNVTDIAPEMLGDYQNDKGFRVAFQQQLNDIWHAKDEQIAQLSTVTLAGEAGLDKERLGNEH